MLQGMYLQKNRNGNCSYECFKLCFRYYNKYLIFYCSFMFKVSPSKFVSSILDVLLLL